MSVALHGLLGDLNHSNAFNKKGSRTAARINNITTLFRLPAGTYAQRQVKRAKTN